MELVSRWLLVSAVAELLPFLIALVVGYQAGHTPGMIGLFGEGQLYLSGMILGVAAIAETFTKLMDRGRVKTKTTPLIACVVVLLVLCPVMAVNFGQTTTSEATKSLPKGGGDRVIAAAAEKNAASLHAEEARTAHSSVVTFCLTLGSALVLVFAI